MVTMSEEAKAARMACQQMSEEAKAARRAYQRWRYAQRTPEQIEKAKERRAAYWERKAEEAARGKS